jgi:ABC-type dipeptide/oligopeptide/nickel transport system permease subunit
MLNPAALQRKYTLAWILMLVLLFIALFGSYIMPHRIDSSVLNTYHWENVNGKQTIVSAPYSPNSTFWLGTDHRGYDLLSLLLNGAKYTLAFCLAVTFLRFVIALPIGLYIGTTGRFKSALSSLNFTISSVPPLLFVLPTLLIIFSALRMELGTTVTDPKSIFCTTVMFGLLVLIGVVPLATQFSERARFYSGLAHRCSPYSPSNQRGRDRIVSDRICPGIVFACSTCNL